MGTQAVNYFQSFIENPYKCLRAYEILGLMAVNDIKILFSPTAKAHLNQDRL